MNITNCVETLKLESNIMGRQSVVYPTLIWDDETVVLIDAGFPGQFEIIREEMKKAGVPFERLNKVILTHQDIDHIGSLKDILRASEKKIEVISHELEKPYINGEKTPIKLAQLEAKRNVLPEDMKVLYEKLKIGFQNCKTNVDKTVVDGEILPYCGGITVIYTPGHTMGHICLYHNNSKTLIAGDALVLVNGQLHGPRPEVTADIESAMKSLEKLTRYDIETVICYHGGVYQGSDTNQKLKELAEGK